MGELLTTQNLRGIIETTIRIQLNSILFTKNALFMLQEGFVQSQEPVQVNQSCFFFTSIYQTAVDRLGIKLLFHFQTCSYMFLRPREGIDHNKFYPKFRGGTILQ